MKTLINNITVITLNNKMDIIENASVVIENDTITRVFDNKENQSKFDQVIDGTGNILMPGFINTHTHVPLSLFRGLGDDMKDRLQKLLIPLEKSCLDSKLAYISAKLSIAEMLLSGTTCFADMHMFTDETAHASKELGMRGFIGQHIDDNNYEDKSSSNHYFKCFDDFTDKYKDDSIITAAIAPHSAYMCSKETLIKCKDISDEYEIPLLIHVGEMKYENDLFKEEYGSVVKYLEKIGLLGKRVVAAHGILVDQEDIEILASNEVSISHCPSGNSKSGRSIAPVTEYIKNNVNVTLATDGPMSGNHMDMTSVMNFTPKMQKVKYLDRNICKAEEVVRMATINGAKALGIDHLVGSIEVGKKADLIIINPNTVNMIPIFDYYSAIVYAMHPSNIKHVMVDGKLVVKNSKLVNCSEQDIIDQFSLAHKVVKEQSENLMGMVKEDE